MRALLVIAGLLLLGGCNMVVTKQPVFAPADAGPMQLRHGVWRGKADQPCDFNEARPITRWPDCAAGFVVLDDKLQMFDNGPKNKRTASDLPYVLAGASPGVLQALAQPGDSKSAGANDEDGPSYFYMGVRSTATDPQGRITAFTGWSVLCGPPPPGGSLTSDGKNTRYGSLEPFPGLTMDAQENDCTPESQAALRGAAAASEQWTKPDSISSAHWVRDGNR
jgi:hypothetical protein